MLKALRKICLIHNWKIDKEILKEHLLVLSSSCASNSDVSYDVMTQSRGFLCRCAETEYTPLESDRF